MYVCCLINTIMRVAVIILFERIIHLYISSPLELWAFVYSSTVHIYSHFSIKCYLFNRGSVIKLIIYVTWTFRMLYLFGEGSELKFICATYLRFEWNNKLQKHNGSHTNSYFWVCFFSPQIFFSLHPLTLIKLPILFEGVFHVQDYSFFSCPMLTAPMETCSN